jgi:uncharacterized membrane protein
MNSKVYILFIGLLIFGLIFLGTQKNIFYAVSASITTGLVLLFLHLIYSELHEINIKLKN